MTWKRCGKKRSLTNLRYYPGITRREWGKPREISVGIADLQGEIWARNLPNTKHECYLFLFPSYCSSGVKLNRGDLATPVNMRGDIALNIEVRYSWVPFTFRCRWPGNPSITEADCPDHTNRQLQTWIIKADKAPHQTTRFKHCMGRVYLRTERIFQEIVAVVRGYIWISGHTSLPVLKQPISILKSWSTSNSG
jgi:hypothetical protein